VVTGNGKTRLGFLATSALCFVVSALAFSGLILRTDLTGRILFGVVWAVLGIVRLGSYFGAFFGQAGVSPKNDGVSMQHDLEELLQAHGLETAVYKGWVVVGGQLPGIAASLVNQREYDNGYSVQLDIQAAVAREVIIVESFAGMGDSEQAAILDAVENLCHSSLHVFLAALWDQVDDQQVTVERWEIGDARWRVFIGNYVIRTSEGLQVAIPEDAFPTTERLIRGLPLEGDLHWIRTFFSNVTLEDTVIEVLHNNEVWEAAQDAISRLEWPRTDKFYSVRNFLIMRREGIQ
jgi:hypothetical protein